MTRRTPKSPGRPGLFIYVHKGFGRFWERDKNRPVYLFMARPDWQQFAASAWATVENAPPV
jgi:hypothetical protein